MGDRELLPLVLFVAMCRPPIDPCASTEGNWLLVYRYSFVQDDGRRVTRETFDGLRFPDENAAYACAEKLRNTGVRLPTLERYGRDSNVMPDQITPMLHLADAETVRNN